MLFACLDALKVFHLHGETMEGDGHHHKSSHSKSSVLVPWRNYFVICVKNFVLDKLAFRVPEQGAAIII